jgi:gliding motility-associated-like protein
MSKLAIAAFSLAFSQCIAVAQTNLYYQNGNPGDTWSYSSTGADATALAQAVSALNYTSAPQSLVVGGNTSGGSCIDGGSGNGPSTARTFTFDEVDISSSNQLNRTLTFNWGNRQPVCTGTGWDTGENLIFTPIHNGIAQANITLANGANDAVFNIATNTFTYTVPPCVSSFSFVLSINTNRRDELLFLDDVLLTTPSFNVPQTPTVVPLSICQNELPIQWNGLDINQAGTYNVTLSNALGCDSLVQLNLSIQNTISQNINLTVCPENYPLNYNGLNITGPGTYTQTLTNASGCDSLINLNVVTGEIYAFSEIDKICETDLPYQFHGQNITEAGFHSVSFLTQAGCDSVFLLELVVFPSPIVDISFSSTTVFSDNPIVVVTNNSSGYIEGNWTVLGNNPQFTIPAEPSPTITLPSVPGTYGIQWSMVNGACSFSQNYFLTVLEVEFVWNVNLPNVFSPNNDGVNDVLSFNNEGLEFVEITILNRWGQPVFETKDENVVWNGKIMNDGEMCEEGVYFYQITYRNPAQQEKTFQNFVHLKRS